MHTPHARSISTVSYPKTSERKPVPRWKLPVSSLQQTLAPSTVVLTDSNLLLQRLQGSDSRSQVLQDIRGKFQLLTSSTALVLQWVPSYCGVYGNEAADRFSKLGSKLDQTDHPIS